MTSRSMPAATSAGVSARAFCGLTRTAVVTPASRTCATAAAEQLGIDRRGVQFLQHRDGAPTVGVRLGGLDQLGELGLDVGVPARQPLTVDHAEPAEPCRARSRTPATPARRSDARAPGCRTGRRRAARPSTRPSTSGCAATARCRCRPARRFGGRFGPCRSRRGRARASLSLVPSSPRVVQRARSSSGLRRSS